MRLHPERLDVPLRWRRARRVFVPSMGDLFHEAVPFEHIAAVFGVMAACPHTFITTTKRPARMRAWFEGIAGSARNVFGGDGEVRLCLSYADRHIKRGFHVEYPPWPLPNVWLGVSVENQAAADERIPDLLATPAAVRWLSVEPMLGPVDLRPWLAPSLGLPGDRIDWTHLDWVVAGGESGPGARLCHSEWARSIRDQCADAGVPLFFKGWGRRTATGHLLDGREHREWPR